MHILCNLSVFFHGVELPQSKPDGFDSSLGEGASGAAAKFAPEIPPQSLRDASPLGDGALGMAVKFPAKMQSVRARQRLPPRGSWQSRQALTEGVQPAPRHPLSLLTTFAASSPKGTPFGAAAKLLATTKAVPLGKVA